MDKVSLNDKTYIKASVIARELGYTTDYVGQLCRGKKVEAQLIGRSWYVNEDSIKSHKTTRYRSDKKVVVRELQKEKHNVEFNKKSSESKKISISKNKTDSNFYNYKSSTIHTPRYVPDESELLPSLKPKKLAVSSGEIEVELAGAEKLEIESKELETKFKPTEPAKIKFKGKLKVKSADDEVSQLDTEGSVEEVTVEESPLEESHKVIKAPKNVKHIEVEELDEDEELGRDNHDNKPKNKVISDRKTDTERVNKPTFSDIVTSSQDESLGHDSNDAYRTASREDAADYDEYEESRGIQVVVLPASKLSFFVLFVSIACAVSIGFALVAVESVTSVDSSVIVSSYEINLTKAWALFLEFFN